MRKSRSEDTEFKLSLKAEKAWAPYIIQYEAFLQPPTKKETKTLLGILRMHRPSENKTAEQIKIIINDITKRLHERNYAKFAIEKGITQLIERKQEAVFFPSMDQIIAIIHPLHWKIQSRMDLLKEQIVKNSEQKLLE